jgi:putative DNA primase/helicase
MAKKKQVTAPPVDDSIMAYNPDDDQLATWIAKTWDKKAAYFRSNWFVYENGCWIDRDKRQLRTRIRRLLATQRTALPKGVSQARISAVSSMLEDDLFIPDNKISEMELEFADYINLRNGLFNLNTFKLEPHRPEMYLTSQLDFEYDPDADCPHFRRFLNTSVTNDDGTPDLDMIMLLREFMAYSMTAKTDLKSSAWLVGVPDSGKSTIVTFMRSLMGNLHATIDLGQLATNRFLLAGIVGKRVVTFTEADGTAFLPDALYKALVGGKDEIYVDVKNRDGISFVPICKIIWAMNGAPRINDRSGATFNRLQVILFDKTIPKDKQIGDLDNLLNSEKAGAFNMLMQDYRRLRSSRTFTRSERSVRWLEQYKRDNDTEFVYCSEQLAYDPSNKITALELYSDYRHWCEESGFKPKNITQVAKEWRRLGLKDTHINGRTIWQGANLKGVNINALL